MSIIIIISIINNNYNNNNNNSNNNNYNNNNNNSSSNIIQLLLTSQFRLIPSDCNVVAVALEVVAVDVVEVVVAVLTFLNLLQTFTKTNRQLLKLFITNSFEHSFEHYRRWQAKVTNQYPLVTTTTTTTTMMIIIYIHHSNLITTSLVWERCSDNESGTNDSTSELGPFPALPLLFKPSLLMRSRVVITCHISIYLYTIGG